MASQEQLHICLQGASSWNEWRKAHPGSYIDLREADLSGADLCGIDLTVADLREADLSGANLNEANLRHALLWEANLSHAQIWEADLSEAELNCANLSQTYLSGSRLWGANLTGAKLIGANLIAADLNGVDLTGADLIECQLDLAHLNRVVCRQTHFENCSISGLCAWQIDMQECFQSQFKITPSYDPAITVDRLDLALLVSLLLHFPGLHPIINATLTRLVCIVGNFTGTRQAILDLLKTALQQRNYESVVLHIERPGDALQVSKTLQQLFCISHFALIDLTDTSPVFLEKLLLSTARLFTPLHLVMEESKEVPEQIKAFSLHRYQDQMALQRALEEHILTSVEK